MAEEITVNPAFERWGLFYPTAVKAEPKGANSQESKTEGTKYSVRMGDLVPVGDV